MADHLIKDNDTSKKYKHFTRHTSKCDFGTNCNFQDKSLSSAGWTKTPVRADCQHHHLVCISCARKFEVWNAYEQYADIIRDVYEMTEWCSSRDSNLIKLPRNQGIKDSKAPVLAAHNVDHFPYMTQVTMMCHTRIWLKLKKAKDKKICKGDKWTKHVISELTSMEVRLRAMLSSKTGAGDYSMVKTVRSKDDMLALIKKNKKTSISEIWPNN